MRPRGITPINGQPPGNLNQWQNGSIESWLRQLLPYFEQAPTTKAQDAILLLGCLGVLVANVLTAKRR